MNSDLQSDTQSEIRVSPLAKARMLFSKGQSRQAEQYLREHSADLEVRAQLREYLLAEGRKAELAEIVAHSDDAVDRAVNSFLQGNYSESLAWCEGRLKQDPDDGPAALHRARALHNLGQPSEALKAFRELVNAQPKFAEAWAACAHALRASGKEKAATQAYERALRLSPGLRVARLNLGITFLNLDQAGQAQLCFEQLLDRQSDDVQAMVYLGLALRLNGQDAMAVRRLKRALMLDPQNADAHRYLAGLYNQAGAVKDAMHHLQQALAIRPDDPDLIADLADIHELSSETEDAEAAVRQGLQLAPDHPQLNLMSARLDRRAGELESALECLRSIDSAQLPPRLGLQHAQELGLVLDRLGRADEAYAAFERANQLAANDGRQQSVDRGLFDSALEGIGDRLDPAVMDLPAGDDSGSDLIFLIGFTRSGTTLLDTFFKPRQDVVSVEEKPTIERVIDEHGLVALGPQAIASMSDEQRSALRQRYRHYLRPFIPANWTGRVIDRMPLRLIHAALIHQLFPKAQFLLAERHPCDVVLSNFMQIFEPGDALVHTSTLASTVGLYDQVMNLWQRIEPLVGDRLIRVRYEDLVENPQRELERLGQELDLEFDPIMLDREQRVAAAGRVRTASYQQVHEAIYQRAAGRWVGYSKYFEPHLATLSPYVTSMGYEPLK